MRQGLERTGVFHKTRLFSTIIGEFFNRKTANLPTVRQDRREVEGREKD